MDKEVQDVRERVNTTMSKRLLKTLRLIAVEDEKKLNKVLDEAADLYIKTRDINKKVK